MAYTAPPLVTTGQLATASDHNTYVRDNIIDIHASLRLTNEIWIPAAALRPHASGGCGPLEDILLSAGRYLQGMPFDPTSTESASLAIAMPKRWNKSTFTFQPVLMNTAGGSGAVVFSLAAVAASNDETLDVAEGTPQTSTDTILAAEDLMLAPASSAITVAGTPANGDLVRFVVSRTPGAAGDTYASDVYLLGLIFRVTVSEPNDA